MFIDKHEGVDLKHCCYFKPFIEYSNYMDNIYENIEEHNPNKECKVLSVLNNMTADILSNEILNPIVTELFIRGNKLNISVGFITESYFPVPKNIRLFSMHCFLMKILNKQKLQQIAFNHLSDIDFEDFINLFL